jgi:arylsulfatase A-like enzyme
LKEATMFSNFTNKPETNPSKSTLLIAFLFGLLFNSVSANANDRPNILIITADNLGYGDLKCYNKSSPIKTPNLDKLATQSARLTSFYTASPTCTVSRACLLSGRIPQRHGLVRQLPGLKGNYGPGLNPKEVIIPKVLSDAGYKTGCFGKWNIGFAPGSRPTERGFHEFFGHASGNIDYYTHVYNQKHDLFKDTTETHVEGYSTDLFANAAIDFITKNKANPWFVYLPFNAPHFPNKLNKAPGVPSIWQAPAKAFKAYGYSPDSTDPIEGYHAVVTALDEAIGRVLKSLDSQGLTENTFVFFYSDNGAFMLKDRGLEVSSNAPLRNGGVTCWEGGLRVAALTRWPKHITPGSVIDEVLWSPDLMTACAQLAEAKLPQNTVMDGRNPLPVLTERASSPHRSLYFSYQKHSALRMGNWKIVRTGRYQDWMLFDLSNDIGEKNNLAPKYSKKLSELVQENNRWIESF